MKVVVAGPQQLTYAQLMNNLELNASGQLVGDLWIACGASPNISHDGLLPAAYTHNRQLQARILTKTQGRESS